jgi:hypothetical protein
VEATAPKTVVIAGQEYQLESRPASPCNGITRCWRLFKLSHAAPADYYVAQHADGRLSCDCMDSSCRCVGALAMTLCKHRKLLLKLGLLETTLPYEREPEAPDLFAEEPDDGDQNATRPDASPGD